MIELQSWVIITGMKLALMAQIGLFLAAVIIVFTDKTFSEDDVRTGVILCAIWFALVIVPTWTGIVNL